MRLLRLHVVSVVSVVVSACPGPQTPIAPPAQIECGAGTELISGVCIATALVDDPRCGEGTVIEPETLTCHPIVECGVGTVIDEVTGDCVPIAVCGDDTFYDLQTRTCVPEATCAPGTIANVATRLCESPVECGAGTTFDVPTRSCLPSPACNPGTILDPTSGLCVGEVTCAIDQVVVNGACVEPNQAIALEADVTEAFAQNDPLLGGVPESIALEPEGDRTIFVGGIDRPQDFDGDGDIDQDRDVWAFDAVAGDYLSLELLSLGLAGPVFVVDGPNGYTRTSTIGLEPEPARELLLPYSGRYEITVVPGAFLSTGVPNGSIESGYVGVIERRALPTFTDVTPGVDGITPATLTGDLLDLDDNFFRIVAPERSAVQITFRAPPTETPPASIVMTDGLRLLSDVQQIDDGDWAAVFTPTGEDAIFVVDWLTSFGPGDDYTVDVNFVPLVESGAVPSDAEVATPPLDLLTLQTGAWQLVLTDDQLVLVEVLVSVSPDVQIVGPDGTRAVIDDEDEFFFFTEAGEYVVFVNNDAAGDDLAASLALTLLTPDDIGALTLDGTTTGALNGPDLVDTRGGPLEHWGIVTVPAASMLALDMDALTGDENEVDVFTVDGVPLRGMPRGQAHPALHVINDDARRLLVRVAAGGENLIDWSIAASLSPAPPFVEVEPNASADTATALGVLVEPITVRGTMTGKNIDLYQVELEAPLAAGQALRVTFDDLGEPDSGGFSTDGASVMIYDAQLQPVAGLPFSTLDLTVDGETVTFRNGTLQTGSITLLPPSAGQGPFFIEVVALFDAEDKLSDYVLRVDVADLLVEDEPNDDAGSADALALPGEVFGYRFDALEPDLYRIELANDLAVGEALVIEWDNLETNNEIDVALETAGGALIAEQGRVLGGFQVPALAAGTYFVRVTGVSATGPLYVLRARIGASAEVEPNDAVATAQALGTLDPGATLEVAGLATSTDDDIYLFTLAAPLAPGEGLRAELMNAADTSSITLELWDGDPAAGGRVLAINAFDTATVVSSPTTTGPFHLRVRGVTGDPDRYVLRATIGGRAELEPNGDAVTATVVPDVPITIEGNLRTGDVDAYAVTLAADTTLDFSFENLADTTQLRVSLRAADFTTELGFLQSLDGTLADVALPAGNYFVVVTPVSPNATGDHYRLSAEVSQ